MRIEQMGLHPDLVTTPLSIDVVTTTTAASTPKPLSAKSVTIEVYEAEDFINEAREEDATLFACVITNPTLA